MKKKIIIFGITGMDGSHLSDLLLEDENNEIHGVIRRSSSFNTGRIDHIYDRLKLHYGDVTDSLSVDSIIHNIKPDEIYILAAQSFVKCSFEMPLYTGLVNAMGVLNILEAARKHCPKTKIYNASTSEMFGDVQEIPQTEKTTFYPKSPYATAKLYAYWICKNYRESYNMFICNGILFNHEGERRGSTFVTKKITEGLSKIYYKIKNNEEYKTLKLGFLDSKRDWGYSKDYVKGMWMMLQQDTPDDFVLATNESHSIREFIEESSKYVNMNIEWFGSGLDEKGIDKNSGKIVIEIDEKYFRPGEVNFLLGDATKAKNILGWQPTVKFKELVKIMMEHDLKKEE